MLRAGLRRSICLYGGGVRSLCPVAAASSASPRCSRALSAAAASNGGGAWGGGDTPAGSRAAPSLFSTFSFLPRLVGSIRPLIPPGFTSATATRAVLGAAALRDGWDMKYLSEASAAVAAPWSLLRWSSGLDRAASRVLSP